MAARCEDRHGEVRWVLGRLEATPRQQNSKLAHSRGGHAEDDGGERGIGPDPDFHHRRL